MRIAFADILLAHGNPAYGMVGPSRLTLNGRQIVDETEFFQAVTASFFGRGGRRVEFSFGVTRTFDSLGEAQAFALLHYNSLPDEGVLRVTCDGDGADGQTVTLEAVFDGPEVQEVSGAAVVLRYSFRGPAWATDESPVPEPDPSMIRRANVAIPADATSVDVVFATAMGGVPFVQVTVLMPTAGGDNIFATVREDSITASGFTAELSGPPSASGYKLSYRAEL